MLGHPKDAPDTRNAGHVNWRARCTASEVETLQDASRALASMMTHTEDGEDDCFRSVWIGMLIGAGVVESYEHAAEWASFVRYCTDDLVA